MDLIMENADHKNPTTSYVNSAFRLGMPHLDVRGVSSEWLLREACHIHWETIASDLGANPHEVRDLTGARVLPSVVACTLNGDAEDFKEGDLCQMNLAEKPVALNGWRSEVELIGPRSALKVEIVTSFSKCQSKGFALL